LWSGGMKEERIKKKFMKKTLVAAICHLEQIVFKGIVL
jgi:hypothetical protein